MTDVEYLVVGQGISGTFLSWYLHQAGKSFIVIDRHDPSSSSRVAAGIINPVTGRRIVKTWMIDELMPFAESSYHAIGEDLGIEAISKMKVIDFFPSAQMLNAFRERISMHDPYLSVPLKADAFLEYFQYDFGYGEINPCYVVNLPMLLPAWRNRLAEKEMLLEESFNEGQLSFDNCGITYQSIRAQKIIFCDGIYSSTNRFFRNLPFALNKGEALVISAPQIPPNAVYKKGLLLAPLGRDLFWAGPSYEWDFTDNLPSQEFLVKTTAVLKQWLKVPFEVADHVASIRPATVERRPFVGMHPHVPAVGILNGMGTKGCSLAPYFAHELVEHLVNGKPLLAEVDIMRFSRILHSSI